MRPPSYALPTPEVSPLEGGVPRSLAEYSPHPGHYSPVPSLPPPHSVASDRFSFTDSPVMTASPVSGEATKCVFSVFYDTGGHYKLVAGCATCLQVTSLASPGAADSKTLVTFQSSGNHFYVLMNTNWGLEALILFYFATC